MSVRTDSPPVETPRTTTRNRPGTDVVRALQRWPDWLALGWHDFRSQHYRTLFGPFWQTVQVGVWVAGLVAIFGTMRGDVEYFPAYVAAGVITWNFIQGVVVGSTQVFTKNANYIQNIPNPLLLYVYRQIALEAFRFLFQLPAFVIVALALGVPMGPVTLLALPGFAVLLLAAAAIAPLLSLIGVRYRDFVHTISALMRFLFFATPIFWGAGHGGVRDVLATYNPFSHYIAIVRDPLLGQLPSATAWLTVSALTILCAGVTFMAFRRFQRSVVFWL